MNVSADKREKRLIISCDSEALPSAAPENHVDRLIWGKFPDAPYEAGIGKLMDIADEFGAKIVFFHDVLETLAYGEETARAATYILDRGHDLQMHAHIEFLPPNFWGRLGVRRPSWAMNCFDEQAAHYLVECSIGLFERMAGRKPVAYRSGAFRYNMSIIKALGDYGIPFSFNYFPETVYKARFPHGFDAGSPTAIPVEQRGDRGAGGHSRESASPG